MRFSSALISFLPSLPTASVAMAMKEPHDSVLHDVTASILEEPLEVKYKNKKSYLEPLKIQNSIDGRPNRANDVELADDKGDTMQKKELIYHLVDHQQHQEGKSLEECNISPTTANTASAATTATTATTATATSDDDSLMKRKISLDKESIQKMDYGRLNRGTCLSPNDACVPKNKAIEGNGDFLEPEDASYASSGYCVSLSILEDMEYQNVVANTLSLIDKEEFIKEEETTESYYHNHPQYDQHHRQLDSLDCDSFCSGKRLDISTIVTEDTSFQDLVGNCYNGECPSTYDNISCWNTAGITDMAYTFAKPFFGPNGSRSYYFNDPLKCWDVGQVTSMNRMFFSSYFKKSIGNWNTSQVKYMNGMFSNALKFNQPIGSWDVSQVKTTADMFDKAKKFNQPLGDWNVSQVESMREMFSYANKFNQPIGSWDVSQVEDMVGMFECYPSSVFNQSLGDWNTSQVKNMNGMFSGAVKFNQPIDSWNVSQVRVMGPMFRVAEAFNQPIASWNTSQVDYMGGMFSGATKFNQPIDSWDVSQVRGMYKMFYATSFDQPIDSWDVSQVGNMKQMFRNALKFNQTIDTWNVSQVTTMEFMFLSYPNTSDFNQCLSTWAGKTSDTVRTRAMLYGNDCPNGIDSPNAAIGPWCQNYTQGCFAPGFEPSQQPSNLPSNKPTDVPTKTPTTSPTDLSTTKSQKKTSTKKTKKQGKKKSKKM